MKLPEGKSRLDLVREGHLDPSVSKRGRLIVSVDKIAEDPKNERKTFRNMDGLVSSIMAVGVIEPITVTPEEGGIYRIITGHRRYRAAKEAGLQQIEVLIRDPEDERARRIKSVVSNVQREDIGPVEMAEALQSLLEDDQVTSQRQLAIVIGKKETWVSDMLGILRLQPKLRQKLQTSETSLPYDAVAKIARLKDEEIQKRLVADLLKGATNRDIRQKIDELKGKKSPVELTPAKPKEVFSTDQEVTIIAQSKTEKLTDERVIKALEQALQQKRNEVAPKLAVVS